MTDAETRLAALLAVDDAPAEDFVFETRVMARVEERRTVMNWARLVAYVVAGLVVAAAALPSLLASFGDLGHLPPQTWPVVFSTLVVCACVAAAWRYLKPLADWRDLISWG
jgi:hypothetical protein